MPKLLDITVSEGGVVEVPSVQQQTDLDVPEVTTVTFRQPVLTEPQITPTVTARQPQLLDIDVSEGGIVESASRQIVEQPSEETGFFSRLKDLFTGEDRATPETEAAPELIRARGIPVSLEELTFFGKMLLTATDEEKENLVRTTIPDAKIRKDDKGNTFVTLPDGTETILNKPGFSLQDAVDFAGQTAIFSMAARFGGRFKPLIGKVTAGGGAAAVTEAGRQAAVQQIGGREEISPVDIGLAGAVGGAGEVLAPVARAAGRVLRRGAAKIPGLRGVEAPEEALSVAREELGAATEAVRAADVITEQTGIPLFQAQKTLAPSALETQSFIASLPGGSRKAAQELRTQNKSAFDAVQTIMDDIAPPEAIETAAGRVRSIAQQAIEAKKTIRAERTAPIYKEAFENTQPVALPKTRVLISETRDRFPEGGAVDKLLNRVEKLTTSRQVIKIPGAPDIGGNVNTRKLHGAKLEIDDMISKFGEGSLGNTEKRELIQIKNSLLDELDEANPAYKQAREAFAAESPAVEELQNSIIGKISKLDDTQLKTITTKLFDPAETNVATIRKARKIIEGQDPQVWRDITRLEFEKRLGTIRAVAPGETTENVPGQLHRALFGNTKQRKVLFAGLDTETAKNVRYLEEGLRRASLGRPGGSQTATREEIKKELKGGIISATRTFVKTPISNLAGAGVTILAGEAEDVAFTRATRALADVMYNPKWQPQLKDLRQLNPNSQKAGQIFLKILKEARAAGIPALQTVRTEIINNE